MMWRDVVDLIPVIPKKNTYGEEVPEDGPPRTVFANKKSVRQSEFYQAFAAGLRPELVLEVRGMEYADEPKLRYADVDYYIIRSFSKNGEIMELVCSRYPMEG
ncbi:hypothetical protein [Paenibacillus sp. IHBB 3054]|uniref:hypothetical protein n=1 Tax=Paenibacillus sp. IHBB 3054 TaxID=3425689 RepID=UPI003F665513